MELPVEGLAGVLPRGSAADQAGTIRVQVPVSVAEPAGVSSVEKASRRDKPHFPMYRLPKHFDEETVAAIRAAVTVPAETAEALAWDDAMQVALTGLEVLESRGLSQGHTKIHWVRLQGYAAVLGLKTVAEMTPQLAKRWVQAPDPTGRVPANSTQKQRRWCLRQFFWLLDICGVRVLDPTRNLTIVNLQPITTRPLTDAEFRLCAAFAHAARNNLRYAAIWALLEVGVTTAEVSKLEVTDCDLSTGLISLPPTARTFSRQVVLGAAGLAHLKRWLTTAPAGHPYAFYRGSASIRQVNVNNAVARIFRKAGIPNSKSVRPLSIRAYLGQQILARTQRIDEVARQLGIRSLDDAARLIGWDWRSEECA